MLKVPPQSLIDELLDSYRHHGGINHIDGVNLPSKLSIAQITHDLLRLLFPGFFDSKALHSQELETFSQKSLETLKSLLEQEILKSLKYQPRTSEEVDRLDSLASELTHEFLTHIPQIRACLEKDVEAAYDGDPAAQSYEEVIVAYPFIEAIAVQRMAHVLYNLKIALIPRIMTEWAHSRTGIDIHPGAKIGTHFFIDHGTGVVIGETCVIGNHVKIYHGVTLGAMSTSGGQKLHGQKRHPSIEDHVTIYPNATILGGNTVIGARSTIAGNVWLTHSVPPDSLVEFERQRLHIRSKRDRHNSNDFQI
ncbi:MAG: serine O-acetyltransferase [Verrucomicrobiae bacterium]|nr:serine O-acetyltransferase [Verrucomicrobiae bacterium]